MAFAYSYTLTLAIRSPPNKLIEQAYELLSEALVSDSDNYASFLPIERPRTERSSTFLTGTL